MRRRTRYAGPQPRLLRTPPYSAKLVFKNIHFYLLTFIIWWYFWQVFPLWRSLFTPRLPLTAITYFLHGLLMIYIDTSFYLIYPLMPYFISKFLVTFYFRFIDTFIERYNIFHIHFDIIYAHWVVVIIDYWYFIETSISDYWSAWKIRSCY